MWIFALNANTNVLKLLNKKLSIILVFCIDHLIVFCQQSSQNITPAELDLLLFNFLTKEKSAL